MKILLPRKQILILVAFFSIQLYFTSCTVITGESIESELFEPTPIETPVLEFSNNQIVWAPIEKADKYVLYLNGTILTNEAKSPFNIDSETLNGLYTIKAFPLETSKRFTSSDFSLGLNISFVKPLVLSKPILELKENKIVWNEVPNAVTYELFKEGLSVGLFGNLEYIIPNASFNGNYTLVAKPSLESRVSIISHFSAKWIFRNSLIPVFKFGSSINI